MKGIFSLLRHPSRSERDEEKLDSLLFSTAFTDLGVTAQPMVSWEIRRVEVGASALPSGPGASLLGALWADDKYMRQLDADAVRRMAPYFDFATVLANRDLIRQDESGNFMVVLLSGHLAIHRTQPDGDSLRLAEAVPGEILGEMSLLDSGVRFSVCTTIGTCEVAVLSADALGAMLNAEPALAASLIALLARKLSHRLRILSAQLNNPH